MLGDPDDLRGIAWVGVFLTAHLVAVSILRISNVTALSFGLDRRRRRFPLDTLLTTFFSLSFALATLFSVLAEVPGHFAFLFNLPFLLCLTCLAVLPLIH